jgi:hypothetical protein
MRWSCITAARLQCERTGPEDEPSIIMMKREEFLQLCVIIIVIIDSFIPEE